MPIESWECGAKGDHTAQHADRDIQGLASNRLPMPASDWLLDWMMTAAEAIAPQTTYPRPQSHHREAVERLDAALSASGTFRVMVSSKNDSVVENKDG